MTLDELLGLLRGYAESEVPLAAIQSRLLPVLAADSLDVTDSDETPWVADPDAERLFWRLAYHLESGAEDGPALRQLAGRVATCFGSTASAATTHELLPILFDQDRLCTVVDRHLHGIVSRTSFLSFAAESGYPGHVRLWLRHASPAALDDLCAHLAAGRYDAAAALLEARPP
ncbi:MAG: hypothetical protein JWL60_1767 [Gemmatimonadetes bacterium]|nr:hypothetical protein [Gemmatimonadota bacterium]